MNTHIVFAICGCLFCLSGISQNKNFDNILKNVEQNNKELKAHRTYIESKSLLNKSDNNIPNPEMSVYYLPFGSNNSTTSYREFEISQSFEFPTVYGARKQWNALKTEVLESEYLLLRQNILLKAKKLLNELLSLKKQKEIEEHRHDQSKKVYDQMQKLFDKGQVGILELNKAKIAWMQIKYHVEQVEIKKMITLKQLASVNGGIAINFNNENISNDENIEAFEILWSQKTNSDPTLLKLKLKENSLLQELKLEKKKSLPNLSIGYNNQGSNGNRISGFLGGVSIPVWNNKNKIKAAHLKHEHQIANTTSKMELLEAEYFELYNNYKLLLLKFKEYEQVLSSLNGDALLFKAYKLGEYSFMQYYLELEFYHNAHDEMLQMEIELLQLKAELLKHKL